MERKLILLVLSIALVGIVGCGKPEGSEGESMSSADLAKTRSQIVKDDGIKPPSDGASSGPAAAAK